jgi:formate C-acetyltransferase
MTGSCIVKKVGTTDILRKAKKHPENYNDLIVRVAGYSDYFFNELV